MEIYTQSDLLSAFLTLERLKGLTIGFVPTMGALHDGHISLVSRAKSENDFVVASIFVNPTQFNNPDDLKNYPRTPEADLEKLELAGTDLVFQPEINQIYGEGIQDDKHVDFGNLDKVLEAEHRPGHFKGVVQVVSRLFDIVQPDRAYFGEKDFQQLAVIRKMTSDLKYKVEIIGCETKRENNGLAMSSRNLLLTTEEREIARVIYQTFQFIKANWKSTGVKAILDEAKEMINSQVPLKVEYIAIADSKMLLPIETFSPEIEARVFAAVFCGKVRLIDNMAI